MHKLLMQTITPEDFSSVREALETKGIEFLEAEIQMVPSTYISLDEKDGEKIKMQEIERSKSQERDDR